MEALAWLRSIFLISVKAWRKRKSSAGTSMSAIWSRWTSRWSRVETAKAVVEVPPLTPGRIQALHGKPGDVVATGAPLVEFELQGQAGAAAEKEAPAAQKQADTGTVVGNMPTSDEELVENAVAGSDIAPSRDRIRAAPAVRALAKRLGVDLASVHGTGRGGLITVDDVMESLRPDVDARGRDASPRSRLPPRYRALRRSRRPAKPRRSAACAGPCIRR